MEFNNPLALTNKTTWHISYLLMALGFFFGITWIIAFLWIIIKKRELSGDSLLSSHAKWQQDTLVLGFFGLLIAVFLLLVGFLTVIFLIGFLFFAASGLFSFGLTLWVLYRIVRGWLALSQNRLMPIAPMRPNFH